MSVPVSHRSDNENTFIKAICTAHEQTIRLMRKIPYNSRHGKEIRAEMIGLSNTMRNSAIRANAIYIVTAAEAKMRLDLLNTSYSTIDVLILHAQDWIDTPLQIARKHGRVAIPFHKECLQNYIGTLLAAKGHFKQYIIYARDKYFEKIAEMEKQMQNPDTVIELYKEKYKKEQEKHASEALQTGHYSPQDKKIVDRMKGQISTDKNGEATINYTPNSKSLKKSVFSEAKNVLFDASICLPDNIIPNIYG